MDSNPGHTLGLSRAQLLDLYPRLGSLLARVETESARVMETQPGFLANAAREALSGRGKRLRPVLLLLSAECAGGATDSSLAMASVVEIVHVASLIHDDVIDDAAHRHGRRSAKMAWGSKVSVLLGDYLIAGALTLFPHSESSRLMPGLADAAARMCIGQVRELRAAGSRVSDEEYLSMVRDKTGSLFAYSCEAGAQTAGASPEVRSALSRFGANFGVAFQLADDILDLIGSNGQSGKSEGRDLAEGKWTLPLICAYDRGDPAVRDQLTAVFGAGSPTSADIALARELVRATGAVNDAWARVEEALDAARQDLAAVPDCDAKRALLALSGERFPMPVMT